MDRAAFLLAAAALKGVRPADTQSTDVPAALQARVPGAGIAEYGMPSVFARGVVRTPRDAVNLAFSPIGQQTGIVTASGLFFTRNHAGVPTIDPRRHRLLVDGMVKHPLVFTLADVMRFPSVSRICFLECAGNSSSEWQVAKAQSIQTSHGLVSCCEWTGIPLRHLIDEVEPRSEASWVLAEGADADAYDRSIPIDKLLDDALLAYGQNGEFLRPEQGFPLRLVLPGYEGSTNIKWLRRLHVGTEPWYTREETAEYTELLPGGRAKAFTFIMEAKSVITHPAAGSVLAKPGYQELRGFAWSGRGKIANVDVSVDGGATWTKSTLQEPILSKCFTRFTHDFHWDGRETTILSRARDETGYVQPTHRALVQRRGYFSEYHNNAIQPWTIASDGTVRDARV